MCIRCAERTYNPKYIAFLNRAPDKLGFCPKCDKKVILITSRSIWPSFYAMLFVYLIEFLMLPASWLVAECQLKGAAIMALALLGGCAAFLCLCVEMTIIMNIMIADGERSKYNVFYYNVWRVIPFWMFHVANVVAIIAAHVIGIGVYRAVNLECLTYPNIMTFFVGALPGVFAWFSVIGAYMIYVICSGCNTLMAYVV